MSFPKVITRVAIVSLVYLSVIVTVIVPIAADKALTVIAPFEVFICEVQFESDFDNPKVFKAVPLLANV